MKANILMKIAVVFMAAFGAYAFSNSTTNNLESFYVLDGGICTNILAGCSEKIDGVTCFIEYKNQLTPVYELGCMVTIRHDNSNFVEWDNIP